MHCVSRMQNVCMLNPTVHKVTTGFQKVNVQSATILRPAEEPVHRWSLNCASLHDRHIHSINVHNK
jgi:hypothetical protein